jgi:pimeloyl-ACP methyl ester carboxylesterase
MASEFPKNYVLLHGAWHGSWCWYKIARHIENLGHNAITPDLPGHHLNKYRIKDISLKSYVDYIENLICAIRPPVVLVGHSMAGVVVTQVAENIPNKIERLIYISGFIPRDGASLMDEEKQALIPSVALEVAMDEIEGLISLPSSQRIKGLFYNKCNEEDIRYALSLLQKQPLRPFRETVSISHARFGAVPKLYIECLQDKAITIDDQRRMYSRVNCDVVSIDTDHSPFFSADDKLTEIISRNNDNNCF